MSLSCQPNIKNIVGGLCVCLPSDLPCRFRPDTSLITHNIPCIIYSIVECNWIPLLFLFGNKLGLKIKVSIFYACHTLRMCFIQNLIMYYVTWTLKQRLHIGKFMLKLGWSACAQLGVPRSLINKGDPNKRALRQRGRLTYLPPGQRMQQNYGAELAFCPTANNEDSKIDSHSRILQVTPKWHTSMTILKK